ncbi:MAG TPA: archease [Thermoleophilaceae bacterium]|nr:archease [Thermoleophilaceae bacterium]
MSHRWVEHTGELELEISASDERAVFAEGFAAMRELLAGDGDSESAGAEPVTRAIELAGSDRAALLADWLAELAVLGETEGLVPEGLRDLELDAEGLRATIEGRTGSPSHLVKGATYHRLAFEPSADGWFARVVLDV